MNDFAPLLKSAYEAQREFHTAWKVYYRDLSKLEPPEITAARDRYLKSTNRVFVHLEKYVNRFYQGDSEAIDAILDFLETDIPAFRCGYAKEKFYRRLKNMSLTQNQIDRVKTIALDQCASDCYRREFRDLARLFIRLADQNFVEQLRMLKDDPNGKVCFKSKLMLNTILNNRDDLK